MPRPKRQLEREAARDTQDPGQASRPGRPRAQRQQTNNNEQNVQAQLAPPQPQAVQLPQAAPQHQAALLQLAAPPQQAQDQAVTMSFPEKVSGWREKDLLKLKISYDDESKNLLDFMALLKEGSAETYPFTHELSANIVRLIDCTKTYWDFSFDFDINRTGGKKKTEELKKKRDEDIENGIELAKQCMEKLQKEDLAEFVELRDSNDHKSLTMLQRWRSYLLDFFRFYLDILKRWNHPSHREGKFTHLFMLFTKICFLRPEPGECYLEYLNIKERKVSAIPDARFIANSTQKLVAVVEMKVETAFIKKNKNKEKKTDKKEGSKESKKKDEEKKKDEKKDKEKKEEVAKDEKKEPFIFKNVRESSAYQHGAELLIEKENSVFQSGVAGIICIGTKVFFTYLKITEEHYSNIKENGEAAETDAAKISYTKPFDFMHADDRKEILEPLFRLAILQSLQSAES